MGRLIDADEFKKYVSRNFAGAITQRILDGIDEQPTAYDADKVVEQLESEATLADIDGIGNCYAIDFQTAVIMVMKGGAR